MLTPKLRLSRFALLPGTAAERVGGASGALYEGAGQVSGRRRDA